MKNKHKKQKWNSRKNKTLVPICPNCGMREKHWISTDGFPIGDDPNGFWICPKEYGSNGMRIGIGKVKTEPINDIFGNELDVKAILNKAPIEAADWLFPNPLDVIVKDGFKNGELSIFAGNASIAPYDHQKALDRNKAIVEIIGGEYYEQIISSYISTSPQKPIKREGHPVSGSHGDTSQPGTVRKFFSEWQEFAVLTDADKAVDCELTEEIRDATLALYARDENAETGSRNTLSPQPTVTVREKTLEEMAAPYVEQVLPVTRIGDMVILDLTEDWKNWASWCGTCDDGSEESPSAYGDWKEYRAQGVTHVRLNGGLYECSKHGPINRIDES